MGHRVTQVARKALVRPDDATARVTQVATKALVVPDDASALVTQVARKVLVTGYAIPAQRVTVTFID